MCEDGKSESTAGAGLGSSRVHPPSTGSDCGSSGRSSRLSTPDTVLLDPDRRVTRGFLADALMDMRIPTRATPSPRPGKKRRIEDVFEDDTPPSPDKLQRELDQQHEEARRAGRPSTPSPGEDAEEQARGQQDTKRQKRLTIRGGNPGRANPTPTPTSAGNQDDNSNGNASGQRSASTSSPERSAG
ncbi:hypothetical protein CPLU01_05523 [Colletotrichum plurivorum]|uniref:Uncharacterized protein n=1 Tax=Colletotrichum plurivorum TaxID=2175906 RepID=A0A8H6KLE2_9PEZI|nr:hypothetical protein CPLU01_05523 [Colletotrichum plurivorum]